MVTEDYDEESKAKRRKEQVEYRNKKRFSSIFMFCATIFEIIETLLIILALFVLFAFLILRVFHADGEIGVKIYQLSTVVSFIGGLVLGFFVYKKTIVWVIKKYKLQDKLMDDVLNHYIKQTEDEINQELTK